MPIFSYFVVVGSALLGLFFATDYAWGPKTAPQSTVAAARAPASPVKVVSTISTRDLPREAPPIKPAVPAAEFSAATTGQAAAAPANVAAASDRPQQAAKTKTAERKKVKTKVAAPRPKWERYARSYRYEYQQPYYQQPYYGGWY